MPSSLLTDRPDDLLEEALIVLFAHWHHLPRRATLPRLDAGRRQLAGAWRVDSPAETEAAVAAFAAALLPLPGIAPLAGEPLTLLARLAETGLPHRPLDASPERTADFVAFLQAGEPPAAALARLQYERPLDAWRQLTHALTGDEARFTPADRAAVAAVLSELQQGLAETLFPTAQLEAYRGALAALESLPLVQRLYAPLLLTFKRDAPRVFLGAGELPAAGAAGAPAPAAGKEIPPGDGIDRPFFTGIDFPMSFPAAVWQPLTVRLTPTLPLDSAATGEVNVRFNDPHQAEFVEVRLLAPGCEEHTASWSRTIAVFPEGDSQPALFLIRTDRPGTVRLTLDLLQQGRLLGSLTLLARADAEDALPTGKVTIKEQPVWSPLEGAPPPPADLELRVVLGDDWQTLDFYLTCALLGHRSTPVGQVRLAVANPDALLGELFDQLSYLADRTPGTAAGSEKEEMERTLRTHGERLFELLLPAPLRTRWWAELAPRIAAGDLTTFLLVSNEPWIPWELVRPYHFEPATGAERSAPFWVEQLDFCRWLAGPGPAAHLAIGRGALVLPELDLPFARDERSALTTLADRRHIALGAPLQRREEVLAALQAGGFDWLHLAAHGSFRADNPDASAVALADNETLTPGDLAGAGLRGLRIDRPLVFFNACHTGRLGKGLAWLSGWPQTLLTAAHVRVYVGTLWAVNDELAAVFSRRFYGALLEGQRLAAALRTARLAVRDHTPENPTWLAYTLYGDPNATIQFGQDEA